MDEEFDEAFWDEGDVATGRQLMPSWLWLWLVGDLAVLIPAEVSNA